MHDSIAPMPIVDVSWTGKLNLKEIGGRTNTNSYFDLRGALSSHISANGSMDYSDLK